MVASEADHEPEVNVGRLLGVAKVVGDYGGGLPVDHKAVLVKVSLAHPVGEDGPGGEAEEIEVGVAVGVDGVGVAVGRQQEWGGA